MAYLLDTQILIWFQTQDVRLKATLYELIMDSKNEILVSQVSIFEIAIKQKVNKLPDFDLPIRRIIQIIQNDGIGVLHINNSHIEAYERIPLLTDHRDPFDRLLLATALAENIPVISADQNFKKYLPQIQVIEA